MIRVWVTRDEPPDGPLASALKAEGLCPVSEPVLEAFVVGDARTELAALDQDDWLALTSARAIRAVAQPEASVPRVAVVGEVSAQIARELGMRVEYVSSSGDSRALWAHIKENIAFGSKVCFPCSSRSLAPNLAGAELMAPVLYTVRDRRFDVSVAQRVDVAVFASPSAVHSVVALLGGLSIPSASIGPTTSAAIRKAGGEVLVECPEHSFTSLAKLIVDAIDRRSSRYGTGN